MIGSNREPLTIQTRTDRKEGSQNGEAFFLHRCVVFLILCDGPLPVSDRAQRSDAPFYLLVPASASSQPGIRRHRYRRISFSNISEALRLMVKP